MRRWKVTASDLYKLAVANMQRLWEGVVEPVQDMIFEMADDQMAEEYGVFLEENEGSQRDAFVSADQCNQAEWGFGFYFTQTVSKVLQILWKRYFCTAKQYP